MRVMLDLNVLLDVAQRREPFVNASSLVLSRIVDRRDIGCMASHALTTLYYVMAKRGGTDEAEALVDWALVHLEIVPQDRAQFLRARSLKFADFEDAVLASSAEASGCELIVTRNVADFNASPIPAVTPEELLTPGTWIRS